MYDETTVQPQYDPQVDRYAVAPAPLATDRSRNRALAVAVVGLMALFGLIGGVFLAVHGRSQPVGFTQTASANGLGQTPTSVANQGAPAVSLDPAATSSTVAATGTGTGTGGGTGGAPAPKGPSAPAPAAPTGPAPVITTFHTPDNIDCHNGNHQTFSASWTTTNAAKTTLSIDGGGIYKTYGANVPLESLPFDCSSPHTFKLTAIGADGRTATKTITLQPRNVQPPQSNDPDDSSSSQSSTPAPPVKHIEG